ncbi:MAG: DsbC family protein [Chromatocurvus sp.]
MIRALIVAIAFGLALPATVAFAASGDPVPKAVLATLRGAIEVPGAGLSVESARYSTMPGMVEVQFKDGPLVYASEDGTYFIIGDLYAVGPDGYVNLAEQRRDVERAEALAEVSRDDMIVFPAKGETRGHITVFTDTTCFYCQKLHKEVPALNERGVEVRYLAYPRSGVGSDGFRQLATAWCDADPQETLTRMKNRETVADNVCAGNPVAQQYELGQAMGVRGTPAIITADGQMIPGYRPVDDLLSAMGLD